MGREIPILVGTQVYLAPRWTNRPPNIRLLPNPCHPACQSCHSPSSVGTYEPRPSTFPVPHRYLHAVLLGPRARARTYLVLTSSLALSSFPFEEIPRGLAQVAHASACVRARVHPTIHPSSMSENGARSVGLGTQVSTSPLCVSARMDRKIEVGT